METVNENEKKVNGGVYYEKEIFSIIYGSSYGSSSGRLLIRRQHSRHHSCGS